MNRQDSNSSIENSLQIFPQPEDNSCLFRACGFILDANPNDPDFYRSLVASIIASSPDKSSSSSDSSLIQSAISSAGHTPKSYSEWIKKPNSWGGATELAILSRLYQIELTAIDVCSMQTYTFGESQGYKERAYLAYNGIHYDAFALPDGKARFPVEDSGKLVQALELAQCLHQAGQFTDTQKFVLCCKDCGALVCGNEGAQKHALQFVGHVNFDERRM